MTERRVSPLERAARPLGLAAAALLVFLMLHTAVAVFARQFFDVAILSLVEYSELVLMGIIFIAIPGSLMRDETIVVDLIDNLVPARIARFFYLLGLVLTLAFVIVTAIAMIEPATVMYERNQYTMVMEIDRFYYWIPILFGFYASVGAVAWLLYRRLRDGDAPTS